MQTLSIAPASGTLSCPVKPTSSDVPLMMIAKAVDEHTCYRCFLADDWNGELIVYAQTARTPSMSAMLRDQWLAQGYAVAIASYTQVGNSRRHRAYHLQQLHRMFTRRCGQPQSVYEIDPQKNIDGNSD